MNNPRQLVGNSRVAPARASGPPGNLILQWIRAGETAPPAEYHDLALRISSAQNERRRCDDDTARALKLLLERSQARKRALDSAIYYGKAFLNPVRSLPAEILAVIFRYACAPHDPTLQDMETLREGVSLDAFHISRVCRFWRRTALALPDLWCAIAINFDHLNLRLCKIVELYCVNSRAEPLSISTYHDPFLFRHNKVDSDVLSSIMEVFSSHKCKILEWTIFGADPFHDVDDLEFPHLHTVRLHSPIESPPNLNFFWLNNCTSVVNLELVHLTEHWHNNGNGFFRVFDDPFVTGTLNLKIHERTPYHAMEVLWPFIGLEYVEINIEMGHIHSLTPGILASSDHVEISLLDGLVINIGGGSSNQNNMDYAATQVLQFLTTPALRSLDVTCLPSAKWDHESFADFIRRSSSKFMRCLTFNGPPLRARELLETLDLLPMLGSLDAKEWHESPLLWSKEVLAKLAVMTKLDLSMVIDHGPLDNEELDLLSRVCTELESVEILIHYREPLNLDDSNIASRLETLRSDTVEVESCYSCTC